MGKLYLSQGEAHVGLADPVAGRYDKLQSAVQRALGAAVSWPCCRHA